MFLRNWSDTLIFVLHFGLVSLKKKKNTKKNKHETTSLPALNTLLNKRVIAKNPLTMGNGTAFALSFLRATPIGKLRINDFGVKSINIHRTQRNFYGIA